MATLRELYEQYMRYQSGQQVFSGYAQPVRDPGGDGSGRPGLGGLVRPPVNTGAPGVGATQPINNTVPGPSQPPVGNNNNVYLPIVSGPSSPNPVYLPGIGGVPSTQPGGSVGGGVGGGGGNIGDWLGVPGLNPGGGSNQPPRPGQPGGGVGGSVTPPQPPRNPGGGGSNPGEGGLGGLVPVPGGGGGGGNNGGGNAPGGGGPGGGGGGGGGGSNPSGPVAPPVAGSPPNWMVPGMGQGGWNEWLMQMQMANGMVNNQAPWLGNGGAGPGMIGTQQPTGAPPMPSEQLQDPNYWAGYNPDRLTQDYDPRDANFQSLPEDRKQLVRAHSQYNAWQQGRRMMGNQQPAQNIGSGGGQGGFTPYGNMGTSQGQSDERTRFMQSMDMNAIRAQGRTPEQVMQEYDAVMAQRNAQGAYGTMSAAVPPGTFDNGYRPDGSNYSPPVFSQPSYDQATMPALDDAQFERLLAWNNSMGLPWSEFIRGSYQNDRDFGRDVYQDARDYGTDVYRDNRNFGEDTRRFDLGFGEDQRRNNRDFGEDTRRFDTTFGEDQFRDRRNFGEDVRRDDRNFGEDTRRYEQDFGEDARRYDTTFGEDQRQYDTTFGENQRQFDQTLEWRKVDDAMRTFGARQMPNVRQVSFR